MNRAIQSGNRVIQLGLVCAGLLIAAVAPAADRDVQIVEIDFDNATLELFNFGLTSEDLTGWRFCTHEPFKSRQTRGRALRTSQNSIDIL